MKKKSGVSIIVLIITISVLIIFTSAVMIPSIKENGIFDKTKKSVKTNNDAILSERITKMNLESMKTKAPFTEKTIKILKATVEQSNVDLDSLGVYINSYNSDVQLVVYRWNKVSKEEIEWFLDNTVTIEFEGQQLECKIYPLFGDINFDMEIDEKDIEICRKYVAYIITQEIDTALVFLDLNMDGLLNVTDVTDIRTLVAGLITVNNNNTILSAQSDNSALNFNSEDYQIIDEKIRDYIEI